MIGLSLHIGKDLCQLALRFLKSYLKTDAFHSSKFLSEYVYLLTIEIKDKNIRSNMTAISMDTLLI